MRYAFHNKQTLDTSISRAAVERQLCLGRGERLDGDVVYLLKFRMKRRRLS